MSHSDREFVPLSLAILTISDTRTAADDRSGDTLAEAAAEAGHRVAERRIVRDDRYAIRAAISEWVLDARTHAIITTGGTGFTDRDVTPEAVRPLFDREIPGFGELFRQLSHGEIGTSMLQSRVLAGIANHTLIACLPGSPGACRSGWRGILADQLDVRHRPCNLAELVLLV
ncbi:molybdenum cofactor biosynthesis protein B [Sediminicurvatus halobius]|uniref:Molybdenum cofactor biosynthesis protein B n=1 Tax=Sediminicurvatus halobius TaxID=2182432 RepID=A0A2U2MWP0_9GAMM|nr:molybdenum cofactor biosynthesis protein B [Spiribacter halobius]PWG61271.1 molybdenum cofactor biosynthesis protein B [Spiribacter halobius]UEX78420.1 molybdenum cofactor biosynthesis protein B [Spiribacter halobius]